MSRKELLVAGGGVSGLRVSASLAERGQGVALVEPNPDRDLRSWFLIKNRLPLDVQQVINKGEISTKGLTGLHFYIFDHEGDLIDHYGASLDREAHCDNYLMVDQSEIEQYLKRDAIKSGVRFVQDKVEEISSEGGCLKARLRDGQTIDTEAVIDATGPDSFISRHSLTEGERLSDDAFALWVVGARMTGEFNPELMLYPLGMPVVRVSWIAPWSEHEADVLASDYCRISEFSQRLSEFKK